MNLRTLVEETSPPRVEPAQRSRVRDEDRDLIIFTSQVGWIEAADCYSSMHVGKRTYLLRESIADLSKRLDPGVFIRVHRSALVTCTSFRCCIAKVWKKRRRYLETANA